MPGCCGERPEGTAGESKRTSQQAALSQEDAATSSPTPSPAPRAPPPVKARAEIEANAIALGYVAVEDLPTWSSLGPQVIDEMGDGEPDDQGFMPQQRLNDCIRLWRGDITRINADAIVNAANWKLVAGGGICGAIFAAAGKRELEAECAEQHSNGCAEGQTVVTSGCKLPARFILHTVGPQVNPALPEALVASN